MRASLCFGAGVAGPQQPTDRLGEEESPRGDSSGPQPPRGGARTALALEVHPELRAAAKRPGRAEGSRASACEVRGLGRPGASQRLREKPEFGAQLWAARSLLGLAFVHLGRRCPNRQPTPAGRVGPAAQGRVTGFEKSAAPSGMRDWVRQGSAL